MSRMPAWFSRKGDELWLNIHVKTRAKLDEVSGVFADRLRIRVKAPPVDGKANKHLLDFLSKSFGVTKSNVRIISGEHCRDKTIAVHAPQREPDWLHQLVNDN